MVRFPRENNILISDFSKVAYTCTYALKDDLKTASPEEVENILRHAMITSLLTLKKRFHREYGDLIIALDGKQNYRYGIHPNYKYKRKENREKDGLPWHIISNVMDKIREEAKEYWPWKVVWSERGEADDVMAVLVEDVANKNIIEVGVMDDIQAEPVLLDTSDGDLLQLQKYENVKQWNSRERKFVVLTEDYDTWMKEFIIKGDRTDGVPGVFSDINCFVDDVRQTPCTKQRMSPIMACKNIFDYNGDSKVVQRIKENYQLVCFDGIPLHVRDDIMDSWNTRKKNSKMVMLKYLNEKGCKHLSNEIDNM